MKVELSGVILENYEESKGKWEAWLRLDLHDTEADRPISEYFYTFASNDESLIKKRTQDLGKSILVQGSFDILNTSKVVENRYASLAFGGWDDFYEKMSQHFVYDD